MQFAGFTPDQQYTLLSRMGYTGPADPKEMEKAIAASPAMASKMGQYAQVAQKRIDQRLQAMQGAGQNVQPTQPAFADGGLTSWFADRGMVDDTASPTNTTTNTTDTSTTSSYWDTIRNSFGTTDTTDTKAGSVRNILDSVLWQDTTTEPTTPTEPVDAQTALNDAQQAYADAYAAIQADPTDQAAIDAFADAQAALTAAQTTYNITEVPSAGEVVGTSVNDPTSLTTTADVTTIQPTNDQLIAAGTGQQVSTPTADATTIATPEEVIATTADTQLAEAAPRTDANLYEATTVSDRIEGTLSGLEAATADPSESATVQGQLEMLMADFDEGTPPWASAAMREASALMARRGMGASSMAGEAIVLAAMQAALPIAMADAKTWATFELQNLNNEQQTSIFKAQQRMAGFFSDQAAENAAKQFNATSQNQTDQFFAGLETQVSQFNSAQVNAISQFNAEQSNIMDRFNVEQATTVDIFRAKQQDAINMFNAEIQQQRDQFNAKNSLIIEQANTQWLQEVSTINTAEQNLANRDAAAVANALTANQLNYILQTERDIMAYSYQSGENAADRNLRLLLADKEVALANEQLDAQKKAALAEAAMRLFF